METNIVTQSLRSETAALLLSDEERLTLVWALEVAHAMLLGDPDVSVLLADPPVEAKVLDDLADRLVLLGQAIRSNCSRLELLPGGASDRGIGHPNLLIGENRALG
jgi:hypothetical protein